MNNVENRVHAALSAAENRAAQEINTAPPLRLPTQLAPTAPHVRPRRHWVRWTAPLAAAAAVVAVAGSLALVKSADRAPAQSSVAPASSAPASSSAPTGPGGIPRYYVALESPGGGKPEQVIVGDTVTGKTLPLTLPGTRPISVVAAANDRTFIVATQTTLQSAADGKVKPGKWLKVQVNPGTATDPLVASITPTPIAPLQPANSGSGVEFGTVESSALSASGQELAVTEATGVSQERSASGQVTTTAPNTMALKVFSVATGQLLHDWSYTAPAGHFLSNTPTWGFPSSLTWINGDRQLLLAFSDLNAPTLTFRTLNVSGPAIGDLATDSTVVESVSPATERVNATFWECSGGAAILNPDGNSFTCGTLGTDTGSLPADNSVFFYAYPITKSAAAGQGTVDYQATATGIDSVDDANPIWVSPDGGTIIAAWDTLRIVNRNPQVIGQSIGVVSGGKFIPLSLPKSVQVSLAPAQVAF